MAQTITICDFTERRAWLATVTPEWLEAHPNKDADYFGYVVGDHIGEPELHQLTAAGATSEIDYATGKVIS